MSVPARFTRIFHPTDFSPPSDIAFVHALKLALAGPTHLTLFHFAREGQDEDDAHEFPKVRDTLAKWKVLPPNAPREAVAPTLGLYIRKVEVGGDDPTGAILGFLASHPPDLIVLATHQRSGVARWLHGEVALPVARQSVVPALFVPPESTGFVDSSTGNIQLQRIVMPVDRHPHPQPVIDMLPALVGAFHPGPLAVEFLHVGTAETLPRLRTPEVAGWTWTTHVADGDVVDRILETTEAGSAELVVLTTLGRHGFFDAIRGSTTERVVRGARCPVLAVPTAMPAHPGR